MCGTGSHVAGAILPRQGDALDIFRGDLLRLAVAVSAPVAAVGAPAVSDIDRAGRAGRCRGHAVDVEVVRTADGPDHRTAEDQQDTEYGGQRGTKEQNPGTLGHASPPGPGDWVNQTRPVRLIHSMDGQLTMRWPLSNPVLAGIRANAFGTGIRESVSTTAELSVPLVLDCGVGTNRDDAHYVVRVASTT